MICVVRIQRMDSDGVLDYRYYATRAFTTKPTDNPPNMFIDGRVTSAALLRHDMFDFGSAGGANRIGYGELVLSNPDGELDYFDDIDIDGRTLDVYIGDEIIGSFPASFFQYSVSMSNSEVRNDEVRIQTRDRHDFTRQPAQTNKFLGNNSLPLGIEGLEDLRGHEKPFMYGPSHNAQPVLVNTTKCVYMVNDGPIRDILAVYDSGGWKSRDSAADYVDENDMMTNAPAEGTYRVWKEGGCFRLSFAPSGQLTCDMVEGNWPTDWTIAQIFQRFLIERAGRTLSDIESSDIAALDAAQRATVGLYVQQDTPTVAAVLDRLCESGGCWWGKSAQGKIRIKRFEPPKAVADFEIPIEDMIVCNRIPLSGGSVPNYRVIVHCANNLTVQTTNLLGSVGTSRRARLRLPYQDGIATDEAVKTRHPTSEERVINSLLTCRSAGQAEAERQLNIWGGKWRRFESVSKLRMDNIEKFKIGATVRIFYRRYGLSAGKNVVILGYQLDPVSEVVECTLWG